MASQTHRSHSWRSVIWKTPNPRIGISRPLFNLTFCMCSPFVLRPADNAPRSRSKQRLDGPAFVHRAVAFRHLFEWQRQVKDLAGIDLAVPYQVDQLG